MAQGRDNRGVDDFARHHEITLALQSGVEGGKQVLDRAGPRQLFGEQTYRLGVGHSILEAEAEEAHEREPILDLELRGVVRQRVERLKDQDLERQHWIVARPYPYDPSDRFKAVASFGLKALKSIRDASFTNGSPFTDGR